MGDWVQMGIKKPASLKTAFWRFLFMLLGGLLGAVAIPFLFMTISTTLGLTTYGDYSEIRANELAPIPVSYTHLMRFFFPEPLLFCVPLHIRKKNGPESIILYYPYLSA